MPIASKSEISVQKLRELFDYSPDTGSLFWKANTGKKNNVGTKAGCVKDGGYVRIQLNKRMFLAHRIAWAIYYGAWPNEFIDHINGDKSDNRLENLRSVNHQQNMMNSKIRSHNKSGLKGAHKDRYGYSSRIVFKGERIRLGWFKTAEEAHKAYVNAAEKYHGEFARF